MKFLLLDDEDNVAVALAALRKNESISIRSSAAPVCLQDDIPMGHKFSLLAIAKGDPIKKYGVVIGAATANISVGKHVHMHNVESLRGRGDKA